MKQRDKIILSAIGCVIVIGGFWMLVLSPKREESKKLDAEIAKQEKANKEVDDQQGGGGQQPASINYAKTYATLAKLGKAVPEAGSVDDDIPSLLLQLNQGAKVTKTGFSSFETSGQGDAAAAPAAAPAAPAATPAEQGTAGVTGTAGAAGAGSSAAAAPAITLNQVSYKYTSIGKLYDLDDLLTYITDLVNVDGARLKVSGRLIEIQSVDFTILKASKTNPNLKIDVSIVSYTTPKSTDGAAGGTGAAVAGAPAAPASSSASSSGTSEGMPGAPPQAQPATPPSATVRRP